MSQAHFGFRVNGRCLLLLTVRDAFSYSPSEMPSPTHRPRCLLLLTIQEASSYSPCTYVFPSTIGCCRCGTIVVTRTPPMDVAVYLASTTRQNVILLCELARFPCRAPRCPRRKVFSPWCLWTDVPWRCYVWTLWLRPTYSWSWDVTSCLDLGLRILFGGGKL